MRTKHATQTTALERKLATQTTSLERKIENFHSLCEPRLTTLQIFNDEIDIRTTSLEKSLR